jgi:hypothetical protein
MRGEVWNRVMTRTSRIDTLATRQLLGKMMTCDEKYESRQGGDPVGNEFIVDARLRDEHLFFDLRSACPCEGKLRSPG